jgi:hypothetical protein
MMFRRRRRTLPSEYGSPSAPGAHYGITPRARPGVGMARGNVSRRRQVVAEGDPIPDNMIQRLDGSYSGSLGRRAELRGAIRWGNGASSATYTRYLSGPIAPPVGGSSILDSPNRALPSTNGPVAEATNMVQNLLGRLPTTTRG